MAGPHTFTSLDAAGLLTSPADPPTPVRESAPPTSPARARVAESTAAYTISFGQMIGGGWDLWGGALGQQPYEQSQQWWLPADRVTLPNHAPLGLFAEAQHRAMIVWARWLTERNYLAIGFWNAVTNFIGPMKVAFVRRDQPEVHADDGGKDPLCRDCQKVWEETCEANGWGPRFREHDREREARRRFLRDSEVIVRSGCGGRDRDFLPWLRFVEPEQVRQPADTVAGLTDGDWQWGICTDPRDAETKYAAWVADPDSGGARGEEVPWNELVYAKANTDLSIKRGVSDFYPAEAMLQEVMRLETNMAKTSAAQAAVAWIERYATALPDMIRDVLNRKADGYTTPGLAGGMGGGPGLYGGGDVMPPPNGSPRHHRLPVRVNPAGTVIHADQNREYDDGPASRGIPGYATVVDVVLSGLGFRWGCPKWFTGESSTFAESLATGSLFVTSTEDRQDAVAGYTAQLAMRVIVLAERSGLLPHGTSRKVKPVITSKPVVIADEQKKASVNDTRLRNQTISPQEVIRQDNLDPDVVLKEILEWRQKTGGQQPGQGNPQQPPSSPSPPPGTDPTPAPPGSAGGDGFGDLARAGEPAQESWTVAEGYTGTLTDSAGRTYHYVNGKRTKTAHKDAAQARHTEAETAAAKAVGDPARLTPDDLRQLKGHLKTLDKPRLQDLARQMRAKVGGTKADLADRLLAGVMAGRAGQDRPGAALAEDPLAHPHLAPLAGRLHVTHLSHPQVRKYLSDLSRVPPAIYERMSRDVTGVYVGDSKVPDLDDLGYLRGKKPRGWTEGSTWEEARGCYAKVTGVVAVGTGVSGSASVALHECGHALGLTTGIYYGQAFGEWHRKLYPGLDRYYKQGGPGHEAGCDETFAESFAVYYLGGETALAQWARSPEYASWFGQQMQGIIDASGKAAKR